jgi:hypothetical protein
MILNLFLIAFCVFLSWLLYRFPLKKAKTPDDFRKLLLFFGVLLIFVLFNGLLAFFGLGGLKNASSNAAITDITQLSAIENGDGVVISGTLSDENDFLSGDYIAYIDESNLWTPKPLIIDLLDGSIEISNDTYQGTNWPVDPRGISYLPKYLPVIVVGYLDKNLASMNNTPSIRADIIYAGSFEDFAARAKGKSILAYAMILANLFVAFMIVLIPIRECIKGIKGRPE